MTEQSEQRAAIDFEETMKTGTIVEAVVEEKDEEEEKESESEEKEEEEEKEEKKSEEKEEEENESEEDKEEEKEEEDEKKEPEAKKKKEDDTVSVDDFIKDEYFEKFEVENKKQLDELLETASNVLAENTKLKDQLEKAKTNKPQFASEHEEKAFEFVKVFSNLEDGMQSMAGLLAIDVDKADAKLALEQHYIIEHPELTREQAKSKFERIYAKKYTVKDKADYESEKDYEIAKEDAEIDLKVDSERARKFLKTKQAEIKSVEKKEKSESPEVPEVVQASIERNAKAVNEHAEGVTELIFSPTDDESDNFTFKLSKEQQKAVRAAAENWVKNPVSYDADGKFKGSNDPEDILRRTIYAMFGDDVFQSMSSHMVNLANIKRAEDIGKKKPTEKSKGKADPGELDIYGQAEHLAKKRKAQERARA